MGCNVGDVINFKARSKKINTSRGNNDITKEYLDDEVVLDFMESMLNVLFTHNREYNSDFAANNMAAITIMFMGHLYPEKYPQLTPVFNEIRRLAREGQ